MFKLQHVVDEVCLATSDTRLSFNILNLSKRNVMLHTSTTSHIHLFRPLLIFLNVSMLAVINKAGRLLYDIGSVVILNII